LEAVNAKKPSSATLAKAYRRLADHPVGGLLVEDLAASREHGLVTARVGIAPDGNPIVYARDEAVAKRIGEAMQNQTAVHVRPMPPLDVREFKLLSRQAESALGAAPPADDPPAIPLNEYCRAVECALVGAFHVEHTQATALVQQYAYGVEEYQRTGKAPMLAAEEINKQLLKHGRAGGKAR
jgi:hypothetical protein